MSALNICWPNNFWVTFESCKVQSYDVKWQAQRFLARFCL